LTRCLEQARVAASPARQARRCTRDRYVFGGPLLHLRSEKRLGFLSGHCTYTNPRFRGLAECEVTAVPTMRGRSLAAGAQITAQGWNDTVPVAFFRQAINGGTAQYAKVRGEIIVSSTEQGNLLVVFRLLP
jgi:hypothetical protein